MKAAEVDEFAGNPDAIAYSLPIRVYYQDTDAGGVVYHSTYLDFMERARYEWLRQLGFDIHSLIQLHKVIFMVRSLNIEYLKPALLDDLLHVTAEAVEIASCRIAISQQVRRGSVTLVNATVQAVCVGVDSLKPVRIPASLRHKFGKRS